MKNSNWREVLYFRVAVLGCLFLVLFILLGIRLWQVQVLQEDEHMASVMHQSIRMECLNPVRGRIFASGGEALIDNRAEWDLGIFVSDMRFRGKMSKTVERIISCEQLVMREIGRHPALSEDEVWRHIRHSPALPLIIAENLTVDELSRFHEMYPQISGIEILPRVQRWYPYPGVASHILGYTVMGMPDTTALANDTLRIYTTKCLSGRSGLEQKYDADLAGRSGSRQYLVDSIGYVRTQLGEEVSPVNGADLHLTLDLKAQQSAERVLRGYSGALVAIDVTNGKILAICSSPGFDLSTLDSEEFVKLNQDVENRPMFNRATQGTYTPGSIVKPLIGMAVLQSGLVMPEDEYVCEGYYKLGNHTIRCARRWGHGELNLERAIRVSCNPFFINAAVQVGIDWIGRFYASAGFGEHTGFELHDAAGVAPSREMARRRLKRNWISSDMAYASIGQGLISITPLQAAVYTAAVANGGIVYRPFIVDSIVSSDGVRQQKTLPQINNRIPAESQNIDIVRRGMRTAVTAREGGAHLLDALGLNLAAKTGTAEVGNGDDRYKNTWTIAYGPYEAPKFAVACVIEHGDSGSKTTVPVVAEFLRQWLIVE